MLAFLGKVVLILVVFVLIKNTNPRVRIDQAMRFFWGPVTARRPGRPAPRRAGALTMAAAAHPSVFLRALKKSPWVFHVGTSGCNNCDIEIADCLTPRFDVERFGVKLVGSPRHADVMLISGPVSRACREPLQQAWLEMPRAPGRGLRRASAPAAWAPTRTPTASPARPTR